MDFSVGGRVIPGTELESCPHTGKGNCLKSSVVSRTTEQVKKDKKGIRELGRELNRKEKVLAETAALLVLKLIVLYIGLLLGQLD